MPPRDGAWEARVVACLWRLSECLLCPSRLPPLIPVLPGPSPRAHWSFLESILITSFPSSRLLSADPVHTLTKCTWPVHADVSHCPSGLRLPFAAGFPAADSLIAGREPAPAVRLALFPTCCPSPSSHPLCHPPYVPSPLRATTAYPRNPQSHEMLCSPRQECTPCGFSRVMLPTGGGFSSLFYITHCPPFLTAAPLPALYSVAKLALTPPPSISTRADQFALRLLAEEIAEAVRGTAQRYGGGRAGTMEARGSVFAPISRAGCHARRPSRFAFALTFAGDKWRGARRTSCHSTHCLGRTTVC